jgi:hypothetical protein
MFAFHPNSIHEPEGATIVAETGPVNLRGRIVDTGENGSDNYGI